MRWWGLLLVGALIGGIIATPYVIGDGLIEELIEEQASFAVGGKVDIDDLKLSVSEGTIAWSRIQVTDPSSTMTNMLETGPVQLSFDFWTWWISGNVVVTDFAVTNVMTGTARTTDGYIEMPPEEVEEESGMMSEMMASVKGQVAGAAVARLDEINANVDVREILKQVNLQSVEKADSLKNVVEERADYWKKTTQESPLPGKVASIQKQASSINVKELTTLSFDPKNLKDAKKIQRAVEEVDQKIKDIDAAVKTVESLQKEVKAVKEEANQLKSSAQADIKTVANAPKQIQQWVKADYKTATGLAKLPQLDAQNIGQALFGDSFTEQFDVYMGYVNQARTFMAYFESEDVEEEEEEIAERFGGEDIVFSSAYDFPSVWIQEILLSGTLNDEFQVSGTITDLVSDQKMIDKATEALISGTHQNASQFRMKAIFDARKTRTESFDISYTAIPLRNIQLSRSPLLPYKVNGMAATKASLLFSENRFTSNIVFDAAGLRYDIPKTTKKKNKFEQIVERSVTSTNAISVAVELNKSAEKTSFAMKSNLDDVFTKNLTGALNAEVAQARKNIEKEIDRRVAEKRKELENVARQKEREIRSNVDKVVADAAKDLGVDGLLSELTSKKSEFEGQVKKDLEKASKDLLKNLGGKIKF